MRRPAVGGQGHDLVLVAGAPEAEVLGQLLVEQAQRVGERLGGEHLERAAARSGRRGGEARSPRPSSTSTAAAVDRRRRRQVRPSAAWATWWGTNRTRSGPGPGSAVARKRGAALRVERPQALPAVLGDVVRRRRRQARGRTSRPPRRGPRAPGPPRSRHQRIGRLRQLPGRERHRRLAVLAPREALLLGGRHDLAVDDERGGGVVEDGVDAQHLHRRRLRSGKRSTPWG